MMKRKHFWLGNFISLSCGLSLLASMPSAQADGSGDFAGRSDSSNSHDFTHELSDQNQIIDYSDGSREVRNRQSTESLLRLSNWSELYVDGDNLCRANNGNIICFSHDTARYLRW